MLNAANGILHARNYMAKQVIRQINNAMPRFGKNSIDIDPRSIDPIYIFSERDFSREILSYLQDRLWHFEASRNQEKITYTFYLPSLPQIIPYAYNASLESDLMYYEFLQGDTVTFEVFDPYSFTTKDMITEQYSFHIKKSQTAKMKAFIHRIELINVNTSKSIVPYTFAFLPNTHTTDLLANNIHMLSPEKRAIVSSLPIAAQKLSGYIDTPPLHLIASAFNQFSQAIVMAAKKMKRGYWLLLYYP